jgi:hypothetical protein
MQWFLLILVHFTILFELYAALRDKAWMSEMNDGLPAGVSSYQALRIYSKIQKRMLYLVFFEAIAFVGTILAFIYK